MDDQSDWDLLVQVRGGSSDAFEVIVSRHGSALFRSARYRLHDDHSAQDAVAEAFAQLWRVREEVERHESGSLRPWLLGVVRHQCLSARRASARLAVTGDARDLDMVVDGHEEWFVRTAWTFDILRDALAVLGADQRECVIMRYVDSCTYEEIAEALGLTQGAVRTRVSRALAAMRSRVMSTDGESCDV